MKTRATKPHPTNLDPRHASPGAWNNITESDGEPPSRSSNKHRWGGAATPTTTSRSTPYPKPHPPHTTNTTGSHNPRDEELCDQKEKDGDGDIVMVSPIHPHDGR